MQEFELTEYVRGDLEQIGYITYAEVCVKGGGDQRADMYARIEDPLHENYGMTIAFEAKLTFNLKVLQQAHFWRHKAHKSFIIVPTTHKNMSSRKFAREVCKQLGIGVMEVNVSSGKYNVTVEPEMYKHPSIPPLYPEQRMIIASNSDNQFMTPFKATVKRMNDYFKAKNVDKVELNEIVKCVKHHYKSDIAARRNIKTFIDKNIIRGFYTTKENNKIVVVKNVMTTVQKETDFFNS